MTSIFEYERNYQFHFQDLMPNNNEAVDLDAFEQFFPGQYTYGGARSTFLGALIKSRVPGVLDFSVVHAGWMKIKVNTEGGFDEAAFFKAVEDCAEIARQQPVQVGNALDQVMRRKVAQPA